MSSVNVNTSNLRIIENDLVPVYETDTGEKVVYGRELHEVLEVKSRYNDWIANRINECDAVENEDYESFTKILVNGGKSTNHVIKLDIAKEMAMLERNDKGKEVRRYFIEVEKRYKTNLYSFAQKEMEEVRFTKELMMVESIAKTLKMNETSKLIMYEKLGEIEGLATSFIPEYGHNDNKVSFSLTELLKKNNCEVKAKTFNKKLIELGYLEEKTRPSRNKDKNGNITYKTFKALTDKGLQYGENVTSTYNTREVQPMYFEKTFMESYNKVMNN